MVVVVVVVVVVVEAAVVTVVVVGGKLYHLHDCSSGWIMLPKTASILQGSVGSG